MTTTEVALVRDFNLHKHLTTTSDAEAMRQVFTVYYIRFSFAIALPRNLLSPENYPNTLDSRVKSKVSIRALHIKVELRLPIKFATACAGPRHIPMSFNH